jgi:hypothetical protein
MGFVPRFLPILPRTLPISSDVAGTACALAIKNVHPLTWCVYNDRGGDPEERPSMQKVVAFFDKGGEKGEDDVKSDEKV